MAAEKKIASAAVTGPSGRILVSSGNSAEGSTGTVSLTTGASNMNVAPSNGISLVVGSSATSTGADISLFAQVDSEQIIGGVAFCEHFSTPLPGLRKRENKKENEN